MLLLYGRFLFGLLAFEPPSPKPYESVQAEPSGANVVGCHMRSLSISRMYAGECQNTGRVAAWNRSAHP
jgi:hypothetical protein